MALKFAVIDKNSNKLMWGSFQDLHPCGPKEGHATFSCAAALREFGVSRKWGGTIASNDGEKGNLKR